MSSSKQLQHALENIINTNTIIIVTTYRFRIRVREQGDMSYHLVVGKLIPLCALNNTIQYQYSAVGLTTKSLRQEVYIHIVMSSIKLLY